MEATQAERVSRVELVDCAEPHDAEVFHNVDLPEGEFPGAASVTATAERACVTAFERYVGFPFEDTEYDLRFLLPNADSWSKGDRHITCLVTSGDEVALEGSVQGSSG